MVEHIKKFEIAGDTKTKARDREVQIPLNVVEADPAYYPWILTDEASLFDAFGTDENEMLRRLALYFRRDFSFSLSQPTWKLVDEIKSVYPNWPYD
jgi:hypothetical protein